MACGNKGRSLVWRKPDALYIDSPKVGIYLSNFTIAQSLDLNFMNLEKLDLFEVLKLIYFRILAPKWQDS